MDMDFGSDIYIMILKLAQLVYLDWKQVKISKL